MPELPEAENIGRALKRKLLGKTIEKVEIFSPAMREPLTSLPDSRLEGCQIVDVRRRGRYVIVELSDGRAFLMHFGMSGVVRVEGAEVPRRKHEHLFVHFSDASIFRFECTRRFSVFKVCELPEKGGEPRELAGLGPEPFSDAFSGRYFFDSTRNRSGSIKNLLMDNQIVVGIGNIYATETLYAAKVSPLRKAGTLTQNECDAVVKESRRILSHAIELGGSSISDFLNVDGSEGKFAQELHVYGRAGQPCQRCGATIEVVKLGGRTSAYCPKCQK